MTRDQCLGTIWVCLCCLFAREGDGDGCDGNGGCAGNPWQSVPPGYTVTLGLTWEEHGCGRDGEGGGPEECECETQSFSSSRCEGCNSHLGGTRHAYTLWRTREHSAAGRETV